MKRFGSLVIQIGLPALFATLSTLLVAGIFATFESTATADLTEAVAIEEVATSCPVESREIDGCDPSAPIPKLAPPPVDALVGVPTIAPPRATPMVAMANRFDVQRNIEVIEVLIE